MKANSASAENKLGLLSTDRRELLKLLIEEEFRRGQQIKPRSRDGGVTGVPASWAQRRLWLIDQSEGGSVGYQVPLAMRIRGALHLGALKQALDALLERHEILRTVFRAIDGEPMQEVSCEVRFELQVVDLSGEDEAQRENQVRSHKLEEVQGRFNLSVGPLIRGRLLRMREDEHVLLLTLHHIIVDGWSKGVLIRELAELYGGFHEGRGNPLKPLPIQYADYAQWQRRQWPQGEAFERRLDYWRELLAGGVPQLELPTDRPWPAVKTYQGGIVGIALDAQLSSKLRDFAHSHAVTLFMVLYAAWAILLRLLSGQEDIVIGSPIANRQKPELEGLIGLFVNPLALRVQVRGDSRLKDFLEHVKEVTLGAYDHQDVPFEKIVEAVHPDLSLSRTPLFRVVFVLHNWPKKEMRLPELSVSVEDEVDEPAMIDLLLSLAEQGDEIAGSVYYATDLFDRQTMKWWMDSFTALLKEMVDQANSRIDDLMVPLHENPFRVAKHATAAQ